MSVVRSNALGHVLMGLLIGVPVAVVTVSPFAGWLAQSFYWLGRERADHEVKTGMDRSKDWAKGWNILDWSHDGQIDLLAPIVVNGLIALAAHYLLGLL